MLQSNVTKLYSQKCQARKSLTSKIVWINVNTALTYVKLETGDYNFCYKVFFSEKDLPETTFASLTIQCLFLLFLFSRIPSTVPFYANTFLEWFLRRELCFLKFVSLVTAFAVIALLRQLEQWMLSLKKPFKTSAL